MNPSETPNSCNRQAGLDSSNLPGMPDSCDGLSFSFDNLEPETEYDMRIVVTGRCGVEVASFNATGHCDGDPGDECDATGGSR